MEIVELLNFAFKEYFECITVILAETDGGGNVEVVEEIGDME